MKTFAKIPGKKLFFVPIFWGFILLCVFSNDAHSQSQTETNPGTYTFTVPAGVTSITVEVWGAGGRGGSWEGNGTGNRGSGGGGGGGAYSRSILTVTPGQSFTYLVGTGSNTISSGLDSYFGSTTTVMAKGGNSVGNNTLTGATGGNATQGFGTIRFSGGNGANGSGTNFGGGGGSSAGFENNGNNAITQTGGIAPVGGGAGGAGRSGLDGPGAPGLIPGGAGGGARKSDNTTRLGGNGANGQIKISWCTISLTSGPATTNQSGICIGSPITPITYSLAGANTVAFSGLPQGVTGTITSSTINISGTPTVAGVYNYTATVTDGNCIGTELTGTLSVSENMAFDVISQNSFCVGTAISNVTQNTFRATSIGTPSNLPPGVTVTWNNNQIEFLGQPTTSGTYNYSIPLSGGCGTNINATGTITINDVVSVNPSNFGSQTRCVGAPFTQFSVNAGVGYTYQWFENTTAATNGTAITGANSRNFQPPSTTPGTKYYYVVVSGACGPSVTSAVSGAIITTAGNTVSGPSTQTRCVNQPLTPILHSTTGATNIGTPVNLPPGVSAVMIAGTVTISGTPTAAGIYDYSIPLTGGCGTVSATGTITVNAIPQVINPTIGAQSRCNNGSPFNPISVGARTGLTYQWYRNDVNNNTTGTAIGGATSNTYTPENNGLGDSYYYVEVGSSATCGTTVKSEVFGLFRVNPLPIITFAEEPTGTYCAELDVTYRTQAGGSNYNWVIPGVAGIDYEITSGGTATQNFVTLQWRTPGTKSVAVNYNDPNGCPAATLQNSANSTVQINTVSAPSTDRPTACFPDRTIIGITHTTTLATGIGNPATFGLPQGLTASWSAGTGTAGTITISGTVDASVAPGRYNYDIPLTGGCGTVSARGFIDVQPQYQISSVTSVAPSNFGGTARITVNGIPTLLTNGTYEVTYTLGLANPAPPTTTTVTILNGRGTFNSIPITNAQLTSLTIIQIKKVTDAAPCFVPILNNNETFFGFDELPFANSGIFYVPAGIFDITIKVWGGGGAGGNGSNGAGGGGGGYSELPIRVYPGQQINLVVGAPGTNQGNGGGSYATTNPNEPNPINSSIVYAHGGQGANGSTFGQGGIGTTSQGQNGSTGDGGRGGNGGGLSGGNGGNGGTGTGQNTNGRPGAAPGGGGGGSKGNSNGGAGGRGLVTISYRLPQVSTCFRVIDDGARTGFAIIEFFENCQWDAPEGLAEFTVTAVGGGGGGGRGQAAGGGGAGGYVRQTVLADQIAGLPANSNFNIIVGQGGIGANSLSNRGGDGGTTSFNGLVGNATVNISTTGGGGGGSTNSPNAGSGANGASGGGGAFNDIRSGDQTINNGGNGTNGFSGGGIEVKLFSNDPTKGAAAGGGGGGAAGLGLPGRAAGSGNAFGGNGGAGLSFVIGDSTYYSSGGGGGNGFNFEGNSQQQAPGLGGFAADIRIGGNGSVTGRGGNGMARTGSGGGSGTEGGGNGGSGRVFITYPVFRILPVEYVYIKAEYQADRSALISWATAKERDNSHFDVERSVDNINNWSKIGEVAGSGNSDEVIAYQFIDTQLPAYGSNVYYRLRQFDTYDNSGLSKVVGIRVPEGSPERIIWKVYPNPTQGKITLAIAERQSYGENKLQVRVISMTGQQRYFENNDLEQLNAEVSNYLETQIRGVYILELTSGNQVDHFKILKN